MSNRGLFLQMTGLSGAGKTTLATHVASKLRDDGFNVEVIDGDEYREGLCSDLGFSKEDRNTNIRRLGFVGRVLARNGVISIMSAINPYEEVRNQIGGELVYVKSSLDEVARRDVKGLYKKAFSGEIKNFTGVSDPFEEPGSPSLTLNTDLEAVEESAEKLYSYILKNIS
jgi:adenylyl-sulfate kinase